MRLPRIRIRTLMAAVMIVALLLWGGMMLPRSYRYHQLARAYGEQEQGWRSIAARDARMTVPDPKMAVFHRKCVAYFAFLTQKYRRAAWHPWEPVPIDPYAPGASPAERPRR